MEARRVELELEEFKERLEAKLTGRAEVAVERCKAGWLSRADGVERLLAWLERRCSRQAVPDVGQELETFLIKTKRRKMEPMQQWTDRFETGYQYLRRALARALGQSASQHCSAADPDAEAEEELGNIPEVFPAIVLGWLMLVRSGLDSRERAAVMTATGGSLDVNQIREKLISSWEEPDQGGANDEDIAAYLAAQDEEAEALAATHTAQRTLRQAREAQADSRLSRGFCRGGAAALAGCRTAGTATTPGLESGPAGPPGAGAKMASCRKELGFNLVASRVAEQGSGDSRCEALFADQAIQEGKGIVDLGCTDAMGGERALDILARKNTEKYGDTRLREVNWDYPPVYSFGNGEKERAYGQVKFGITGGGMEGDISINGFAKEVPILVSKKVLKKLGAVVDCDTGVAVFVKLARGVSIQLEESPDGGHYYMSLVDDLLEQKVRDPAKLQNFKMICNHLSEWSTACVAACQGPDLSPDVCAERGLHKAEVSQLLQEFGMPYSLAWSVDELKQVLKENMFPKAETAAQIEMRGLNSMKTAQLLAKSAEVGAHVTPGMTNPSLKLSIRKAILQKHPPEPTDDMGFGKYGAVTYQQVLKQYPSYAAWTMDVMMEDELEEQERLEAAAQEEKNTNQFIQQQMLTTLSQLSQRLEKLEGQPSSTSSNGESFVPCIKENGHTEDLNALLAHGGIKLMEVACSLASILSTKMAEKFGEDAVRRFSAWNGHRLGTPAGNQRAREARDDAEPDHLWVGMQRGPLSSLTLGFNGTSPVRAEATRKGRLQAIKAYRAAVQLVCDQRAQGKHAHWEWPIKCEGWGHRMIRQMIEDCSMTVVQVAGCQLGVKNEKSQPLLKEWLIATTSSKMAARMALECPGGHKHGDLTGGSLTAATSYYTDEFAKRAVRAMIEEVSPDYREFLRCLTEPEAPEGQALAAGREETSTGADPGSKEYQQIMCWLASVHRGSGHSSKTAMLNALRRKGASQLVLQVAQGFFTVTRVKSGSTPCKKIKSKFPLIIDENCRVRVSKLLYHMVGEDRHRNPVWADLKVKADPEGSWMSKQAADYFDSDSIGYEPIPGRAHWHISLAEEATQATKGTMDRLAAESPEMAPGLDGHFFEKDFDELPYVEAQRVDKEYGENCARMYAAAQEYLRQVYMRRISRAENAKDQALKSVAPSMWARCFRKERGETKGRFKGLARVPATETARPMDGDLGQSEALHPGRPGSVVWLVRAGRIIKVDLCQIRAASAREIAYAELMGGKDTPWTINTFMNQAMRQEYLDFTGHDPKEHDVEFSTWEGVPDPAPPLTRTRTTELVEDKGPQVTPRDRPAPPVRKQIHKKGQHPGGSADRARTSRAAIAEKNLEEQAALMATATPDARAFWARQGTPLEASMELPLAGKALRHAPRHMSTYMASQLRKGKREISERTLNPDELDRFNKAKASEEVMRMRWILEWKIDESTGDKKAKARIVVLGYMDPEYEHRSTTAPTMTRASRHLLLQMMSRLGFKGHKADVTGAFNQNRETQHNLFVMPVKELATALGLPEGVAMRLRKAVYGLVEAAIEWFMTVGEALTKFGWTQMKMDPCVWVLYGDAHGRDNSFNKEALQEFIDPELLDVLVAAKGDLDIVAVAGSHVDDSLLRGKEFMQTGVKIKQQPDRSFRMDRNEYVKTIEKAFLTPERKKNKEAETTDREKGQLRAILGAVGCHSQAQVLVPIEWSDSSESNRPDGKSSKGLVAGMAPVKILKGDETDVILDELFGIKLQWLEMLGNNINWRNPEDTLAKLPGAVVVDAKGLYDKLQTTVCTFRGKEKRTDVETMTLKERTQAANNWMLWVHGDAQLANSLTKGHESGQLRMYFSSGHRWKLVYDAKYQIARKRKAAGILPFENVPQEVVRSSESSREPASGAANQEFPEYEAISSDESDEDSMLNLEDPYPCRSGSEQA
ncbi:unnamed protein product [Prorocentrum cordatum]|uniref:Reverse transcriptase Ty1/copia-type domain-containing protein n=1 Tax=Prorocentrum cordatum TaxID=2364126 RepID=A0ABN9PTJ5_9DINO|nr:unnamed protein product [Polarella glacialis]